MWWGHHHQLLFFHLENGVSEEACVSSIKIHLSANCSRVVEMGSIGKCRQMYYHLLLGGRNWSTKGEWWSESIRWLPANEQISFLFKGFLPPKKDNLLFPFCIVKFVLSSSLSFLCITFALCYTIHTKIIIKVIKRLKGVKWRSQLKRENQHRSLRWKRKYNIYIYI